MKITIKQIQRRFISLLLIVSILVTSSTFAYWASSVSGDYTEREVIVSIGDWDFITSGSTILTKELLIELLSGNLALDEDYILTKDIDLSDYSNNDFAPISGFTGTLDGNGYTIGGFSITKKNTTPTTKVGIFTSIGVDSIISNLHIENVTVTQSDKNNGSNSNETSYVGVLVGQNNGLISNVQVTNSALGASNSVQSGSFGSSSLTIYSGGLVGQNNGVINNSFARVDVTLDSSVATSFLSNGVGNIYVGGLVGNNTGTITQSYATGTVTNNVDTSTGFWATVTIQTFTGGLVGLNASSAQVSNVFATGNITVYNSANKGKHYIGLVVGKNEGTTSNLYSRNNQSINSNRSYTQNKKNTRSTSSKNLQSATYLSQRLGFDFDNIWETVSGNYPVIRK